MCKQVSDCSCPTGDPKKTHSTSCINGKCSCDNAAVNAVGKDYLKAVAAASNAKVTKAIDQLIKGVADAKEVAGIIAEAALGPEAKAALKVITIRI